MSKKQKDYPNLKVYTSEEARLYGKLGGMKSGENRRKKRKMKETIELFFELSMKGGRETDIEKIKNMQDLKGRNISVEEAIVLAQINKALKGDTQAFVALRDSSGNKPKDEVEFESKSQVIIVDDLEE